MTTDSGFPPVSPVPDSKEVFHTHFTQGPRAVSIVKRSQKAYALLGGDLQMVTQVSLVPGSSVGGVYETPSFRGFLRSEFMSSEAMPELLVW